MRSCFFCALAIVGWLSALTLLSPYASAQAVENEPLQIQYLNILRSGECPSVDDFEYVHQLASASLESSDENLAFLYFLIEVCDFSFSDFGLTKPVFLNSFTDVIEHDPVAHSFGHIVFAHLVLTEYSAEGQARIEEYRYATKYVADGGNVPAQLLAAWLSAEELAERPDLGSFLRGLSIRRLSHYLSLLHYSEISPEFDELIAGYVESTPGLELSALPDWYVGKLRDPENETHNLFGNPYEYCWDRSDFRECSRAAFVDHFTCLWIREGGDLTSDQYAECRESRLNN